MNLFKLDVDDSLDFFCPRTGSLILGPEYFDPSPATAFVYIPEICEFETIEDGLEEIWDELEERYGEEESPWDLWGRFLQRVAKDRPNVLVFAFTSHGMACGPVSSTVYVGIDFGYATEVEGNENDDEEDEG
jgi:hypothetical protein